MSWKKTPWSEIKPGQKFRFGPEDALTWTRAAQGSYAISGIDVTQAIPHIPKYVEVNEVEVQTLPLGTKVIWNGAQYTTIQNRETTIYSLLTEHGDYLPFHTRTLVEEVE